MFRHMKRTTVRLPDDLMRRARRKAAESGRTLTSFLEEGLKAVLADPPRSSRKPVRLPVSKAVGGTLPGVDLNRSADLQDIMEAR
jgi:hypothetical protein